MTPAQLLDRKRYIGSSEAAPASGLSTWCTPYELWLDKTGDSVAEKFREAKRKDMGQRLEAVVLEKYCADQGVELHPCEPIVSADYPWMRASPDGLLPDRVVEAKTAAIGGMREWGTPGTDAVPLKYLLQAVHLMIVTGRRRVDMPVLLGGDYQLYEIEYDAELAEMLLARERDFWRHVEERTPPAVQTIDDAKLRWPKDSGITAIATREIADAVIKLREVNAQRDALEADADALSLAIRTCMAEASVLTDSAGTTLATWKAQQRTQFEYAEFKRAHPDLYEQFSTKHSSRVFRLSKGKA